MAENFATQEYREAEVASVAERKLSPDQPSIDSDPGLYYKAKLGLAERVAHLAPDKIADAEGCSRKFRVLFIQQNKLQLAVDYAGLAAVKAAGIRPGVYFGVNIFKPQVWEVNPVRTAQDEDR